jgi:hypothetical protein
MSNSVVRWTVRACVAVILLVGTVVLGAGTSSADPVGGLPGAGNGANGTSWTGGTAR